jgi:hypothetical protein
MRAAVDTNFRKEKFQDDRQRVKHFFTLHQRLTTPLTMKFILRIFKYCA